MDFQSKSSLAIFIPQTSPLLIGMTKISTVGNVIWLHQVCVCFISLNFWRHGRQDDKQTAYTSSWEGCKLVASEFSSGATKLKGFGKLQCYRSCLWKQYSCKDCCALSDDFCNSEDFSAWEHLCACTNQLKIQLSMGHGITHKELLLPPKVIISGNEKYGSEKYAIASQRTPNSKEKKKFPSYKCAEKGWTWPLHLKIPLLTAQTYEKHKRSRALQGLKALYREENFWLIYKQQAISKSNFFKTQALEPGRCFLKLVCKGQQKGKRQYGKSHSLLRDAKYKNFLMYWRSRIYSHFLH